MKLTYRPEIDGLRAIAVSAIILYHAQITILGHQPFKGGFIGVDIFFVISGYLITSIILKELWTTGSFSFYHFYERRVRRILPALLFVMLVSLPFAWMYLLPSSFIDFSKSILYSLGFSSNFYFHYSGQQYGAESGLLKPFLHTWSLSVEEQYYILFPVVLLIAFKFFRKYLIHILIFGFVISLGLAEWTSRNYPSASFYFLHTRMWELIAGSILAYFEITLGHRSKRQTLNLILPTIGLLLIGYSIINFNNKMFHPSFYTLSPIIGVCLIIWFSHKDELITKILSTKLFVGIGLISYSLYLWHYPIFAFDRLIEFTQGSLFNKLLLGLVILLTSIFSYFFIERPFRNKNNKFKVIISLILISISILFLVNLNIIFNNGFKNRVPEILSKELVEKSSWNKLKNLENKICNNNTDGCRFNTNSNKKIYVIGDSHMGTLLFDLKNRIIKNDYQFISYTLNGCLYFPGFYLDKKDINDKDCSNDYFKKIKKTILEDKDSIIIFGGRYELFLSGRCFNNKEGGECSENDIFTHEYVSLEEYDSIENSFKNEVSELLNNNKVILVYPIPEVGWNVPRKLNIFFKSISKTRIGLSKKEDFITTSYKVYQIRNKASFELFDSIKNENVYRVYPHKLLCNTKIKNRCVTHDDKDLFYSDHHHPSHKGAKMINDLIMKEIEKIEVESK